MSSSQLAEVPVWECHHLVQGCTVGRLCVIEHGYPIAFPVNFVLMQGSGWPQVVVRTSPTATFTRCDGPASFEVDYVDAPARRAWSVLMRGTLRKAGGLQELPDPHPWVDDGRYQWMVLDVSATSGRRFVGSRGHEGDFAVEWDLAI